MISRWETLPPNGKMGHEADCGKVLCHVYFPNALEESFRDLPPLRKPFGALAFAGFRKSTDCSAVDFQTFDTVERIAAVTSLRRRRQKLF